MKKNNKSLLSKTINGVSWLFMFQIFDNILGFIRLIIIARILNPHDFGLIGIAALLMQILNTFSQAGIQQYIIYKKDYKKYMNVGWTFLVFRGFILYLLVYLLAPYVSIFFNSPQATEIIRIVGLTLVFEGLTNIGIILFQKEIQFNKQFIYQLSGNFSDFIVVLICALIFQNVWALVAGILTNSLIRFLFSYILSSYRPRLDFTMSLLREINTYGKWIFGSTILQFLYTQGDDILVGRLLGTTQLGFYQYAYRISNLPTTQITYIISTVIFPAYAKINNSINKITEVYYKNLQIVSYLSFLISFLIIVFINDFVILFLGSKWIPIIPSLQLLTIWGMIRSIGSTTGPVWQAIGTPQITTKIQLIQVVIMFIIIYPLTMNYGIEGTAIAVVISALIPNIISIILINRLFTNTIYKFIIELIYPLSASLLASSCIFISRTYLLQGSTFVTFFVNIMVFLIIYVLTTSSMSKKLNYSFYKNIYSLLNSFSAQNNILTIIKKIIYTLM